MSLSIRVNVYDCVLRTNKIEREIVRRERKGATEMKMGNR